MTTIPKGRKKNLQKLQARKVIFALNSLEEVIKGNIIPHLNFFFLKVFMILSWWEAALEEKEDGSEAEDMGNGVKMGFFKWFSLVAFVLR